MRAPSFLILLAASCVGLLSGCSTSADPEERAFFNRGWINPRELDNNENVRRLNHSSDNPPPPPNSLVEPLR